MIHWLKSLESNEKTYWLGLGLLFAGLSLGVSVATAMIVVGAVLIITSTMSSFFLTWLSAEKK